MPQHPSLGLERGPLGAQGTGFCLRLRVAAADPVSAGALRRGLCSAFVKPQAGGQGHISGIGAWTCGRCESRRQPARVPTVSEPWCALARSEYSRATPGKPKPASCWPRSGTLALSRPARAGDSPMPPVAALITPHPGRVVVLPEERESEARKGGTLTHPVTQPVCASTQAGTQGQPRGLCARGLASR